MVRHLDGTVHTLQRHVGTVPDSLGWCVTTQTVPCSWFRIQIGTLDELTAQWLAVCDSHIISQSIQNLLNYG